MKTIHILIFLAAAAMCRADTIELTNGAKVEGRVLENNQALKTLTIEFNVDGALTKRVLPWASVKAVVPKGGAAVASGPAVKTPAEVRAIIAKVGPTEPDWLASTQSNPPKTLDLSWPEKPPPPWNNQKNVNQYIWDVINPNATRWREGLKLVDQLLKSKSDPALK